MAEAVVAKRPQGVPEHLAEELLPVVALKVLDEGHATLLLSSILYQVQGGRESALPQQTRLGGGGESGSIPLGASFWRRNGAHANRTRHAR